jgi:hypothetical protein
MRRLAGVKRKVLKKKLDSGVESRVYPGGKFATGCKSAVSLKKRNGAWTWQPSGEIYDIASKCY